LRGASLLGAGSVTPAAALCALAWCCGARADPAASVDTGTLQDIVVTAERLKLIGPISARLTLSENF